MNEDPWIRCCLKVFSADIQTQGWIRLIFSLKELARKEGGARMERGQCRPLVGNLKLMLLLHTRPSNKAAFPKPSDTGYQQGKRGQPSKWHFTCRITSLSDARHSQGGQRGPLRPSSQKLWRQVSAEQFVSYFQGHGNIHLLYSYT